MTTLSKAIYRFNAIPKITNCIFHRTRTKILKYIWRHKSLWIAKVILKEEWTWRKPVSCFQIILQSYSHQNSGVVAQKQTSDWIRSITQLCLTLCDPMNHSAPGLPVHRQLREFTETHVHWVSDAIQPPHPLLSPSPPAPNPSQHQSLFQWVNSSREVAKVLEFQL